MSLKITSRPFLFAAVAGVAAAGIGAYVWHEQARPPVLEVYLFSLKGGQAAFIRTPDDKRILIDGGANGDIIREITSILPFYSRRIDAVIATQADAAHVSGLVDVISRYLIGAAYIPAVTLQSLGLASSTDPAYQAFLDALDQKKIEPQSLKADDSVALDSSTALRVLFPPDSKDFAYSRASSPEVLLRIDFGATSIAFLGEATVKVQKYVASSTDSFAAGDSNALIVFESLAPGNIALQLFDWAQPDFLIYSQAPPRASSKKGILDPIADLSLDNRFNLKEKGKLKIVSDGKTIKVIESF